MFFPLPSVLPTPHKGLALGFLSLCSFLAQETKTRATALVPIALPARPQWSEGDPSISVFKGLEKMAGLGPW